MMKTLFLMVSLSIALLVNGFSSHSGGAAPARIRGVTYRSTSSTCLHAAAAPKKKKASKKKASKKAAEVETFKKPDFVASIQDKTGLSKADSAAALDAVLETISEQVSEGKRISLVGFGTFKLSHRAARKGRNPQTGEEIDIAASNSPSFSASKTFKEMCNR